MRVEITNKKRIFGLNGEQKEKIKDSLTFDNPAYKNAKRFSKRGYISIPPYLHYYEEERVNMKDGVEKVLDVPVGANIEKILGVKPETINLTVKNNVGYFPDFNLDMRADQLKAFDAYMSSVLVDIDNPKSIIQLPTGKGKSILALYIAYKLKAKTLILVHKDDLVVGWQKDIKLCFGDSLTADDVGLIKAKSRKVGRLFTIATVQTLHRMSEEELWKYINQFTLVVQDEVHHIGLNMFNIIDKFNSRYKLGLTATPKRSDGLNFVFDLFFGGICYKHEVTEDDEDIAQVEVEVIDSNYKYKPFWHEDRAFNYYDFKVEELPSDLRFVESIPYKERPTIPYLNIDNEAVRSSKTKNIVCKKMLEEYRQGHSVIALFTQKEHIDLYYRHLCRYMPKSQIILYYGDSKESSEDMMRRAENKEALVTLATYAKATEGTNVKAWEVEFLVSSLNNEKNVEQATGRIRRKKEGKLNPVKVYDVRYSGCYSLRSHYSTRCSTYNRLKYKVNDKNAYKERKNNMFSRGYN